MSYDLTKWALTAAPARTPRDRLVLATLATFAGPGGAAAWPSVRRVAALTRLTPRSVRRALSSLCAAGLIERRARLGAEGQMSNVYEFPGFTQPGKPPAPAPPSWRSWRPQEKAIPDHLTADELASRVASILAWAEEDPDRQNKEVLDKAWRTNRQRRSQSGPFHPVWGARRGR